MKMKTCFASFTPGFICQEPKASRRLLLGWIISFRYVQVLGFKKFSFARVCPSLVKRSIGTHSSRFLTTTLRSVPSFCQISSSSDCSSISNSSCMGGRSLSLGSSKKEYLLSGMRVSTVRPAWAREPLCLIPWLVAAAAVTLLFVVSRYQN